MDKAHGACAETGSGGEAGCCEGGTPAADRGEGIVLKDLDCFVLAGFTVNGGFVAATRGKDDDVACLVEEASTIWGVEGW